MTTKITDSYHKGEILIYKKGGYDDTKYKDMNMKMQTVNKIYEIFVQMMNRSQQYKT